MKLMFSSELQLDYDLLIEFLAEAKEQADEASKAQLESAENDQQPKPPKPRGLTSADSYREAIARLPDLRAERQERRERMRERARA
jgi:hypothetical protein